MRFLRAFVLAFLLPAFVSLSSAYGHSGGTDANGCHTNRKTGDYHCHGAKKSSSSSSSASTNSSSGPSSSSYQSFSSQVATKPIQKTWSGKVVGVSDGDTITVLHDGKPEVIRLYGVDCPEDAQAFSTQAKKFTSDQVFSKHVEVRSIETDRYGRTVGNVVLADGSILSEKIVQAGYGWWFQKYAPLNKKLEELENSARYFKLGLWKDPSPTAPWDYREKQNSRALSINSFVGTTETDNQSIQVYRTKTGAKYHRAGCRSLSRSMIPVTVKEAQGMGLGACSICNP